MSILKHFVILLKLCCYYLVLFTFFRLVFCILNYSELEGHLTLISFVKALYLDLSAYSYITLASLLATVAYLINNKLRFLVIGLHLLFTLIIVLLFTSDAFLYREWHTKISIQAIDHLKNPSELFRITPWWMWVITILISSIILFIAYHVLRRIFLPYKIPVLQNISAAIIIIPLAILGVRGGIQPIPIQESDVITSTHPAVNDMSINTAWYVGHVVLDYYKNEHKQQFNFFTSEKLQEILNRDTTKFIPSPRFILSDRPNICMIILESFNANCSKYLGTGNFTPHLDQIAEQGISFNRCYATAHLSDQGIPAILSGLPSLPSISLINQSEKSATLPCINKEFTDQNYSTGFLYGGDLSYGNIKNYLTQKRFQVIKDEDDFKGKYKKQRLGINDADFAHIVIDEMNKARQPFFYNWFTISSHIPYDIPRPWEYFSNKENGYLNSVKFTDSALGLFFQEAKKQDWYRNTLFVLVADHSHDDSSVYSVIHPYRNRIPLVFFGEVIAPEYRGKMYNHATSQYNIATTLLSALGLPTDRYQPSRNLFDTTHPSAIYNFFSGTGYIEDDSNFIILNQYQGEAVACESNRIDSLQALNYLKAKTQENFRAYIGK